MLWNSKQQKTVETSAFSAEHIALKVCIEAIEGLRYKTRMFGIPLCCKGEIEDKPAYIFCDNESVVKNTSNVDSTLSKKHSSVAYHFNRSTVAAGIARVAWIITSENLADPFTKQLSQPKRNYLFGNWTY